MEFKDKLKQLRLEKKLSQQALADQLYVSRSAIAKWENGIGYPCQDSYDALISFFGVDPDYFQTEEPERIIVTKNKRIGLYQHILISIVTILLFAAVLLGVSWFKSVQSTDIAALEAQAAKYFGYEKVEVITTSQRGDFLASVAAWESPSLTDLLSLEYLVTPNCHQNSKGKIQNTLDCNRRHYFSKNSIQNKGIIHINGCHLMGE